ncbi:MAG: hypothetical protein ACKOD2_00230, partial [Ilumatobacteraceae bacterium]
MTTAVALVFAAMLAAPGVSTTGRAATGTVVDEGWVPSFPQGPLGMQGVRFRDVPEYNESVSVLRARPDATSGRWRGCTSITVAPCTTVPVVNFSAILQPCATSTQVDCIVGFGTLDPAGAKVPATYTGAFPSVGLNDFPAEPSIGLPAGGPGGMWSVAESSGAKVRTHFLRAVVSGQYVPGSGKNVTFTNFAANLSPVTVRRYDCGTSPNAILAACQNGDIPDVTGERNGGDASGWGGYVDRNGTSQGLDCQQTGNYDRTTGEADCAERKTMSRDIAYYLTVRMSQAISGWMHGRLADPAITLEDVAGTAGAVTLSVSGKPVSVPAIELQKNFSDLPAALQDKYRSTGGWPNSSFPGAHHGASSWGTNDTDRNDPLQRNRKSLPSPYGADAMDELEAWIPVVSDTAVADLSTWTLRTLGSSNLGAAAGCVTEKNKVTGFVTTNATQYRAGAPEYDSSARTLNYKVSAPHYLSSGELFRGAYSLFVWSDGARCIYRFSSAPIKATIEVVDTGAEKSNVVTNVSEANGWMTLSASGFTHSSPTIKATFTQDASPDIRAGKSLSRSALLKKAGLKTTSKSRVTLAVASSSRKVCRVSGTSVR